jgi:hypothetical protein
VTAPRDITQRFLIVYNEWPVESFDDETDATMRMHELRGTQLRAWREKWPMHGFDNRKLWSVQDMAKKVAGST